MRLAGLRDQALHRLMQALPMDACSALGAELGPWLGQRANPEENARAKALLRRLQHERDEPAIAKELRLLWRNIGRTFAEFSVLPRIIRERRVTISAEDVLWRITPNPRPLIVCFVHLGNWEALGATLAQHPAFITHRNMSAVVAPPTDPARAAIAARLRGMLPVEHLPVRPLVWRAVMARLRRPFGTVWLAVDGAEGGVDTPLFGRPARPDSTLGKIIRVAASTRALVLPVYCERLAGANFVGHVLEPYEPPAAIDPSGLVREVTLLDAVFDAPVRRLVSQWYMAIEFPSEAAFAANERP